MTGPSAIHYYERMHCTDLLRGQRAEEAASGLCLVLGLGLGLEIFVGCAARSSGTA